MPYLTPELRATRERLRKEFSSRLNEAMERAGMSQARLVQLTGIPQANLSAMMNARLGASTTRLTAIARALNVEPHDLIPVLGPDEELPPLLHTNTKPVDKNTDTPPQTGALAGDLMRPPGGWLGRTPSGTRSRRSAGLERHILKVERTATIEMLRMLEEVDALHLADVAKDDEFWVRQQAFLQGELDRRDETRKQQDEASKIAKDVKDGGGHARAKADPPGNPSAGRKRAVAH